MNLNNKIDPNLFTILQICSRKSLKPRELSSNYLGISSRI